ncbi:5-formyltetrahydrofolate cyclo-ligase [[Clostridium] hylemonae]|uniref:5-formyltetrahydrofolate cyclo-ligase n=1 Tax=[Clostridium] hylemonae TaxID=89153 RepID=UPI001F6262D8|nr:5-formyltetrahydrofolate cyclo-ligase [[Clostridium] hylemonae]
MRNLAKKEEIRQEILKKRLDISPVEWQNGTESITKEVTAHAWFREATDIYCYVDCRKEAGTKLIIEEAWRLGKTVWVPRTAGEEMDFYEIHSFTELSRGCFGVLEPEGTTAADGSDGLMIMPGVVFDEHRGRLGYGKGYYDRYLGKHPGLHTIAAAFDLQIVDEVPQEDEDVRPQLIITETRTI